MWKKVTENDGLFMFFKMIGEGSVTHELHALAETFVCTIYADKQCKFVNKFRGKMYRNHLHKNGKVPDISLLPPCATSLLKHTIRSHYVAKMWKLACLCKRNLSSFQES